MKTVGIIVLAAGLVVCLGRASAQAQHGHVMEVGSAADGGGDLLLRWDFDGQPIVAVYDSGFPGLFEGDVPGFNDAADAPPDFFELDDGTEVEVELTHIDDSISILVSSTLLSAAGDTAVIGTMPTLHNHPDYRLTMTGADEKTFIEGQVAFRVREGSSSVGYTPSRIRSLTVSNGYLPRLASPATPGDLGCLKAVTKAVGKFVEKKHKLLAKCMNAVWAHEELGKSEKAALKACDLDAVASASLVGKIGAEKDKALDAVAKGCGPLSGSSTPFTESIIHTHLGMAGCRVEELIGAEYGGAADALGHVLEDNSLGGEDDVLAAFPCVKGGIGQE